MAADSKVVGYKLPVNPEYQQGKVAQGFVTPTQDKLPQVHAIPPRRVLPIIFIPGIMGSNLRMSEERKALLKKKNNIAWRPDKLAVTLSQRNETPRQRQLRLDPDATEVDTYDPGTNPTGNPEETSDMRHEEVTVPFGYGGFKTLDGPMLQSDSPSAPNARTKEQKARARGWGEVYYSSYDDILMTCEMRLNGAFSNKSMDIYLTKFVAEIAPSTWQAHPALPMQCIDEKAIRAVVKDCWFPVHAMGYNWLRGNGESGTRLAKRISALIETYKQQGYQCEKVILVTHSMGGLVARAIIHPKMGNINDKVLGVIHGVMPAVGAGAAYKRMRCGFEGDGISAKVLGHVGDRVTAVLGNSQGGLELLPSEAYGKNWLQVRQNGLVQKSLPEVGDPYEEIYKLRGSWYGLLKEEWINPACQQLAGFQNSCILLDKAKAFHRAIATTYHALSYAHYGADPKRSAWHNVIWEIEKNAKIQQFNQLKIVEDNAKGQMTMIDPTTATHAPNSTRSFTVKLADAADPGDQTVPAFSADAQLRSNQSKGIFRQTGYEHQSSYSDPAVIASTLFSLFKIAEKIKWSEA